MRLIFAGTPEVAVPSLRRLLESGRHEVVAVVTRPSAPSSGRKKARLPIADLAKDAGIPIFSPQRAGDPDFLAAVSQLRPDCCPVVAYGALLPPAALAVPALGWVNLHFSLLPAWRGAAPVQAAIASGDEFTGATTFLIEEGLDTGPVFGVVTERIAEHDTAGELLTRLADSGAALLERTIDGLAAGSITAVPQAAEGVSYAPKVTAASARVRWNAPALVADRQIRAVTPAPGAWSELGGARIKIASAVLADPGLALPRLLAGELHIQKSGVYVGTASTALELKQVQPQGKKLMNAADWARGARLTPGAVLA